MEYAKFERLETEHLILREFYKSDVDFYYNRIGSSQDVTRYMLWEPHMTIEESEKSIEKIMARHADGNDYTWGIALKKDDTIIGRIDLLRLDETDSSCSFAYMLGKEFWGKGYGTQALCAVFAYAFEQLKMKRIAADHMTENTGSGKVMQKAGMQYVGTKKAKYEKKGRLYDADEYAITFDAWKSYNEKA